MFRKLAELPIPIAGNISSNVVHITYSVRDHVQKAKKTLSKTVFVDDRGSVASGNIQEVSPEVVLSAFSPSGHLKAILRESGSGDDKKKRFVEIWRGDFIEISTEVTDLHGAFYSDDYLSTLLFSPTESAVVYTAEANPPGKDTSLLDRFRFTPSFGEGLSIRKRPTTFIYRWRDINNNDILLPAPSIRHISVSHPIAVFFGQATFISDTELLATGYEYTADGRLLGIKGCFNRPAGIWRFTIPSTDSDAPCDATKLTPSDRSCRSPRRFDPQSQKDDIFWLSTTTGGAHAGCSSLHRHDPRQHGETRVVLESVWEAKDDLPGLYLDGLPQRPFLEINNKSFITCHSIKQSRTTVLLIEVDGGAVFDLTPGGLFSWAVLGTDGLSRVLCSRSSPTTPHEVVVLQLDETNPFSPPAELVIDQVVLPADVQEALSTLDVSVVPIPGRYPTETIVYKAKDIPSKTPPMITIPHGGPHGTTTTAFSASTVALALEGYTLSLPNYTGSLGFGEKFVQALRGSCGSLDVEDCLASVNYLVDLGISKLGKGQQFVSGGSHGGFLAGHLIGQYPDVFSAAVLRNPVISCGELGISDIPDWAFAELGLPFTPDSLVTPEVYEHLHRASPIAHVDNVTAKVLLLIGGSDMRVPPPQAMRYYHALKARSKEVEMLWFEKEGHPLEGVEATEVGWEVSRDWFKSVQA